ncbi:MAG: hypothetical protein ACK5LK_08745 [Chthoniobacterales bacterium]
MRIRSLLSLLALILSLLGSNVVQAANNEHPGSLLLFLSGDQVRKELKITKLQAAVLDSLKNEYQEQAQGLFKNSQTPTRDLAELETNFNKRTLSTLSSKQKAALPRIEHAALKGWMLTLPQVQKEIGLDAKQIRSIEKAQNRLSRQNAKLLSQVSEGKISNARRLSTLREARLDAAEHIEASLTPDQLQAFLKLREK